MGRHFTVNAQRLRSLGREVNNQSAVISRIPGQIQEARRSIQRMSGMREVCEVLDMITKQINLEKRAMNDLAAAACRISDAYKGHEEAICRTAERSRRRYTSRAVGRVRVVSNPNVFISVR